MVARTPSFVTAPGAAPYVELHAHSNHSFLDGVCAPEALVAQAAARGMAALALTDHDGLYGAVRFVMAAKEAGIKPILGAEVTLEEGDHLTLLAKTRKGYANLCQLITLAHRGQPKGEARLNKTDLAIHAQGLIGLSGCRRGEIARLIIAGRFEQAVQVARQYSQIFGPLRFYIELQRHYHPGEMRLMGLLLGLADRVGLPVVATGDVHYLHPSQREVHDILTCIRHQTTLEDAGDLLRSNDEYCFRTPQQMVDLFANVPEAIENTLRIAARCASASIFLPSGPQALPLFPTPGGQSPGAFLRELCQKAMRDRYPIAAPHELLDKELSIINQMKLANYFLIVWDMVRFAREQRIRCQGRGSAANSLVAYLLDITPIDPVTCDLVFERFLSPERPGPPDIDIDFAADRREEVIQYVYQRYGQEHAAMACTLVTFRARSAVRDVAKALGFPPALVERLSDVLDVGNAKSVEASKGSIETFGPDLAGRPFQNLMRIVPQLDGTPRHPGIHNGGMVISGPPLCEIVPLEPATMENRIVTQWDKDALESAGMIKIDILGLRMLSAIEDAVTIIEGQTGIRPDLDDLPPNDPEVFAMLCRGETIGVFQVESRAQADLIPRFQPRSFADLVIEISLIRPGPIQANMVHPYLRRRQGRERVSYLYPLLKPALHETLGVIVFQEQVIKVARDLAGFVPGEAERLRRALSHKRAGEEIQRFRDRFIRGAVEKSVPHKTAERAFEQLRAFGGYAFPKSHAAAFAVLTYQSAWLRRYYPAAFFAGLLRHQPMGFYPPSVIVSEARRCGVEIRPVDVQSSSVLATADEQAVQLGLAMVNSLGLDGSQALTLARNPGPFQSLADLVRRTRLGRRAIEALIWSGALDGWGMPRRRLFWDLQAALESADLPPTLALESPDEHAEFEPLSHQERVWMEVAYTGVSSGVHMVSLIESQLKALGVTPSKELGGLQDGVSVRIGGMIISRQHPPTAKGTAFLALEDERGIVNVILPPDIYDANRKALHSLFVVVEGQLQRQGQAISVLAQHILPLAAGDR